MVQIAVTGTQSWTVKLNICCIVCKRLFSMHDFRKPCETHDRSFKLIQEKKKWSQSLLTIPTPHLRAVVLVVIFRGVKWGLLRQWRSCTRAGCNNIHETYFEFKLKQKDKALKIKWPVNTKYFRTEINKTIKPSNVKMTAMQVINTNTCVT